MLNVNRSNIEKSSFKSHVEYLILKWKSPETLMSLWWVETSQQALEKVYDIISRESKYNRIIPLKEDVLYKLLFDAFFSNRSIEDQISIFLRQISSKVAWVKVEVWFIVWEIANNTYQRQTPNLFDDAA